MTVFPFDTRPHLLIKTPCGVSYAFAFAAWLRVCLFPAPLEHRVARNAGPSGSKFGIFQLQRNSTPPRLFRKTLSNHSIIASSRDMSICNAFCVNKAIYRTGPVACGWAGAVMQKLLEYAKKVKALTTNRPTDQLTI